MPSDTASRLRSALRGTDRAQGRIVPLFFSIMVTIILGASVAIPVILDITAEAGVTGTTALVLGIVPLFIALLLIMVLAKPIMRRVQ